MELTQKEPSVLYLRIMQRFGIYRGMSKTVGNFKEHSYHMCQAEDENTGYKQVFHTASLFFHGTVAMMGRNVNTAQALCRENLQLSLPFTGVQGTLLSPHNPRLWLPHPCKCPRAVLEQNTPQVRFRRGQIPGHIKWPVLCTSGQMVTGSVFA